MKRMWRWGVLIGVSVVVLALLPWVVFPIIPSKAGFFTAMLLFMLVNPLVSVGLGILAGGDIRGCWLAPLLPAVAFCGGMYVPGGSLPSFPLPVVYAVLCTAAMLITYAVGRRKQ